MPAARKSDASHPTIRLTLLASLLALAACDTREFLGPDPLNDELLTKADSIEFLARHRVPGGPAIRPRFAWNWSRSEPVFFFGRNVYATVEVIGLESTLCHTLTVSGGISQTLFDDIGGGEGCQQPAGPVVIGPVPQDGEHPQVSFLFFSIGSYWTDTSRRSDRVWEVRFEDWEDYDFNDVVIRISFADVPQQTISLSCSPGTLER